MTWYANEIFEQQVSEGELGQYDLTCRRRNTLAMADHSLDNQIHWAPELHQQSHADVSAGITPNTSSWSNIAAGDPSSMYGWSDDQHLDEALLGSSYGTLVHDVHDFGMSVPMGLDVATEPDTSITLGELLRATQLPLDWTHHSGSPGQFASSWESPVSTTVQHSDHDSFVGSDEMTPETTPFHSQPLPGTTGYRAYIDSHTGPGAVRSAFTTSSMQPRDDSSPVSDASSTPTPTSTSRPRGERWPLSTASTFRCMWRTHGMLCSAMIPGDRKSVSSHLRDVHNFTCDGRLMACEWGDCTSCMQRRNIPRHIVTRHFEVRVECPRCGLSMSRADANRKHQLACRGIGGGQSQNANGSGSISKGGANRGGTAQTRWC